MSIFSPTGTAVRERPNFNPRISVPIPVQDEGIYQELIAKLESAGYTQIRDIKSTAEGISVKAMKDGKDVSLVVDSSGQVKERK